MTASAGTTSEQIAILKANRLYSGIRITVQNVVAASGALSANDALDCIEGLTVDVPEYGARSRRIDLDTAQMKLLPTICKLGSVGAVDAAASTNVSPSTGVSNPVGMAYFDIPINKLNLSEDTRITMTITAPALSTTTVSFSFLDTPFRNVYFRPYTIANTATASVQQWFPSDGVLRGIVTLAGLTANTAGAVNYFLPRQSSSVGATSVTQISLNGEQNTTYLDAQSLAAGLDEVVSGGVGEFWGVECYSLIQNFPASSNAQYIQMSRVANLAVGQAQFILGVMSDA